MPPISTEEKMEIITRKEAKEQGLRRYYTAQPCNAGHYSERYTNGGGCIDCLNANTRKRMAAIYSDPDKHALHKQQAKEKRRRLMASDDYRERQNRLRRDAYATNEQFRERCLQGMRDWESKNSHKRYEIKKRWSESNRDKCRQSERKWRKNNPGKARMLAKIWRIKRREAMPEWVNKKHVQDFYDTVAILNQTCGCTSPGKTAFHVDHIIPLRHPDVCGLHVPWNLQVLPAGINIAKSNKLEL